MPAAPFVSNEALSEVEGWNDPVRGVVSWRTLLSAGRTPSDSLTMGVAEVGEPGEGGFRLHRHAQSEAYYVLSGRGVISIAGAEHPLAPGDVAFIPGGALHGARGVGPEPLRLLYVFAADAFEDVVYEFPESA